MSRIAYWAAWARPAVRSLLGALAPIARRRSACASRGLEAATLIELTAFGTGGRMHWRYQHVRSTTPLGGTR